MFQTVWISDLQMEEQIINKYQGLQSNLHELNYGRGCSKYEWSGGETT